jgi:hypothetical protein
MKAHCCNLQSSHTSSLRSSLILSSDLRIYFQRNLSLEDCRLNCDMYLLFTLSVQATCTTHPTLLHPITKMVSTTLHSSFFYIPILYNCGAVNTTKCGVTVGSASGIGEFTI